MGTYNQLKNVKEKKIGFKEELRDLRIEFDKSRRIKKKIAQRLRQRNVAYLKRRWRKCVGESKVILPPESIFILLLSLSLVRLFVFSIVFCINYFSFTTLKFKLLITIYIYIYI